MAVTIDINANPKGFESGLDSMRAKVNGFATHLGGLGTKIAGAFAADRLLDKGFEVLREGIEDIKEFKDQLEDVQASLGVSADEAQRFSYAVKRADADTGETIRGMLKLKNLARDAIAGDPNAKETFANLGIDEKAFAAQSLTEQVLTLSDAFKQLSKSGAASDVALQFLEVLGTKNRSPLKLLGRDRDALAKDFSETKVIGGDKLDKIDKAKEEKEADENEARAELANSGAVEGSAKIERLGRRVKSGFSRLIGWVGNNMETIALQTLGIGGAVAIREASKPAPVTPSGFTNPFTAVQSAVTAMGGGNKALTGTGTTEKMFGNASQRAAMAERARAMDFHNSQLLETDPKVKMNNLLGERQRILDSAAKEPDKAKAFDLSMKAKSMEPEIMGHAKEALAPDTLTVKAGHIAEIGGGGPVATFGGAEVKIAEGNNFLREIRDALVGKDGGGKWSPGNIPNGEGPVQEPGFYPTSRPVSVDNFPKER